MRLYLHLLPFVGDITITAAHLHEYHLLFVRHTKLVGDNITIHPYYTWLHRFSYYYKLVCLTRPCVVLHQLQLETSRSSCFKVKDAMHLLMRLSSFFETWILHVIHGTSPRHGALYPITQQVWSLVIFHSISHPISVFIIVIIISVIDHHTRYATSRKRQA